MELTCSVQLPLPEQQPVVVQSTPNLEQPVHQTPTVVEEPSFVSDQPQIDVEEPQRVVEQPLAVVEQLLPPNFELPSPVYDPPSPIAEQPSALDLPPHEVKQPTVMDMPPQEAELPPQPSINQQYCLRFENNGSKKWDSKEIILDAASLENKYDTSKLFVGMPVQLPWKGKGGREQLWNLVITSIESKK